MHRFKLRIDTRGLQFTGEADVYGHSTPEEAKTALRSALGGPDWHLLRIDLTQTMDDADAPDPRGGVTVELTDGVGRLGEVRDTPVNDSRLLQSIHETLNTLPERTATAVLQVPESGALRAAFYVNVGNGLSFMGWGEKLKAKPGLGLGVAVRKTW